MYSRKIIQNLKPEWYLKLSQTEKQQEQKRLQERHEEAWQNKPDALRSGTIIVAKNSRNTITKGCCYYVREHLCTLVTTLYESKWSQHITIKNDFGFTVKMNLNNFDIRK